MKGPTALTVIFLCIAACTAHVSLVHPPARFPAYDFLDNVRTGGPCGVPYPGDDDAIITTFATGSSLDVRFHLAYPHRGGVLINILHANGSVLHKVFDTWNMQNDSTSTSVQVTLPSNFTCDRCILQLVRQAGEWVATGGYVFWTCADISIQDNSVCNNGTCSGNGQCMNGLCQCDALYSGDFCQHKDDCADESHCNNHGSCQSVSTVKFPRQQCFCDRGWFGRYCELESTVTDVTVNESLYTIHRKFGGRLNVWTRLVNEDSEIEVVLSVNATGYVAFGIRPPSIDSTCRNAAPGAFAVGTNPSWPNGQIENVLGISGEFTDGGAAEEEEEEEEEAEEEAEEEQEEEQEEEEEEEEEEEGEEGTGTMHPMDCTDIVIGAARGNQYRVLDYYTRDRTTPMLDGTYGGTQDLTGAVGQEVGGVTTIKFRRRLQSGDSMADHSITDDLHHVIWSFGQVWPDYTHNPGSGIEAGTAANDRFYQPDEIKYHGSRNRGAATINFFLADQENDAKCYGTFDSCSAGVDCDYSASWEVRGSSVLFNVTARVTDSQWVAIGFSDNMLMESTDVVVGATDGTRTIIQDRWSTALGVMPRLDTTDNLMSTSVTRENGFTTISFVRSLDTLDRTDDLSLMDDRFFIYGWGGSVDYTTGNIGQHPTVPIVSNSRITLPTVCTGTHEDDGSGAGMLSISLLLLLALSAMAFFATM